MNLYRVYTSEPCPRAYPQICINGATVIANSEEEAFAAIEKRCDLDFPVPQEDRKIQTLIKDIQIPLVIDIYYYK